MLYYADAGMRIGARALYDYEARSDKELTFNRGDALQVITKTPDSNWWDGFHSGKRGFIPVAYVEITELKTSPSPPAALSPNAAVVTPASIALTALPVPAPPQRKSSIPNPAEVESSSKPNQPSIQEEDEEVGEEEEEVPNVATEPSEEPEEHESASTSPPSVMVTNEEPEETVKSPSDVTSPTANFPVKSVRSLTKQFQEPEPSQQQKVLVEPRTHRRHDSDQFKVASEPKEPCVSPPRSASGGSKVSMLSSTFNKKVAVATGPPPPTRPKPPSLVHPAPSSPAESAAGIFPLMQHPGAVGLPGVSPLQRAAHQSQHKPPVLGKKPVTQPSKPAGKAKSTAKIKKKDSLKKDKSSKPVITPKPVAGFVATPEEIQAQLQARAKRKQSEDTKL